MLGASTYCTCFIYWLYSLLSTLFMRRMRPTCRKPIVPPEDQIPRDELLLLHDLVHVGIAPLSHLTQRRLLDEHEQSSSVRSSRSSDGSAKLGCSIRDLEPFACDPGLLSCASEHHIHMIT